VPETDLHEDDFRRRLGRSMVFAAWIVALAILTLFFNHYLAQLENPNQQVEMATDDTGGRSVTLQRNRAGHYVVNGEINGRPVVFVVDTGATDVAMSLGVAHDLDLSLGMPRLSRTANGVVRSWSAGLDRVSIGGLEARGVRASVLPNFPGGEVLLGMSFLKRFELVQRGNVLIVRDPG